MKVMKSVKIKEVGVLGEGFCHGKTTAAGCEKVKIAEKLSVNLF